MRQQRIYGSVPLDGNSLVSLIKQGQSVASLAEKFSVSKEAIYLKIRKADEDWRPQRPPPSELYQKYVVERCKMAELVALYGASEGTIFDLTRKYGMRRERVTAEQRRRYACEYVKNRRISDLNYKLAANIRARTRDSIRRSKKSGKSGSAIDALGIAIGGLRLHIERMFDKRMTWENWGEYWQIDHIRPLASFDLADREQFLAACHFSNLRPLRKLENLSKGDKREYLL